MSSLPRPQSSEPLSPGPLGGPHGFCWTLVVFLAPQTPCWGRKDQKEDGWDPLFLQEVTPGGVSLENATLVTGLGLWASQGTSAETRA